MPYITDYIEDIRPDELSALDEYMRSYRARLGSDVGSLPFSEDELEVAAEYIRSLRRGSQYPVAPSTTEALQQTITEALQTAISEPQSAETDGVKITNRSIPDLIEADKYLRSIRSSGFSIKRIIPGGSVRL